jgi:hypothetical protein
MGGFASAKKQEIKEVNIYTELKFQMLPDGGLELVSEKHYEYSGDIAKLDRAASSRAKDLADSSQDLATQEGSNASSERAQVMPFFSQEMHATHGFSPSQLDEQLTAAESGSGSATGVAEEKADLQNARTRNGSGFAKTLEQIARDKQKADAGASESIAAADARGAQEKNQAGAAGMAGLYGEDLGGQARAMGLEDEAINTEIQAGKSGWLQNMDQTIDSIAGAAKAFKGGK